MNFVFHWLQDFQVKESSIHYLLGGAQNLLDSMAITKHLGEVQGPLASLTIRSYDENIKELEMVSTHMWVNGDFLDNRGEVER